MLERIQLGLAEAHGLAAAQLAVAKVIQRLGNHGLVERMRCGHAASLAHVPGAVVPASRSSRRRARRSSRNSLTNAVAQAPCAVAVVLTLAVQQCWQVGGELRAIHARFSSGLTRQSDEQRQHRPAERRWCMGGRAANEADAIGAILDALVQAASPAISRANCAM